MTLELEGSTGEKGDAQWDKYDGLTPEERARITEIQDFLMTDMSNKRKHSKKAMKLRAKEIGREIKELQREKEEIKEWAAA